MADATTDRRCVTGGEHELSPLDDGPDGGLVHERIADGCGARVLETAEGEVLPFRRPPRRHDDAWWDGVRAGLRRCATWRHGRKWVAVDGREVPLNVATAAVNREQAAELLAARPDDLDPPGWVGFTGPGGPEGVA